MHTLFKVTNKYIYIYYIYIYIERERVREGGRECVCLCVCVCERERERDSSAFRLCIPIHRNLRKPQRELTHTKKKKTRIHSKPNQ